MKPDITTRADIELLVNTFYQKVVPDRQIGPFFNQVAKVDWTKHLPRMYAFWEMVLFQKEGYNGHPMAAHFHVHQKVPLQAKDYDRWLKLFVATVDEHFSGPKATEAKIRGHLIAQSIHSRMTMFDQHVAAQAAQVQAQNAAKHTQSHATA